jgi:WD40 repeat protein
MQRFLRVEEKKINSKKVSGFSIAHGWGEDYENANRFESRGHFVPEQQQTTLKNFGYEKFSKENDDFLSDHDDIKYFSSCYDYVKDEWWHKGKILCLCSSAILNIFATGSDTGEIKLWSCQGFCEFYMHVLHFHSLLYNKGVIIRNLVFEGFSFPVSSLAFVGNEQSLSFGINVYSHSTLCICLFFRIAYMLLHPKIIFHLITCPGNRIYFLRLAKTILK